MEQNKTYSLSKEDYQTLKAHWSKNYRGYRSCEMVIYNLLRDKPAKNGFVEKKKNIQGNDPWFGLRKALGNAIFSASDPVSKFYWCTRRNEITEKEFYANIKKELNDKFRAKFGIDLPDFLSVRIANTIKELEDERTK